MAFPRATRGPRWLSVALVLGLAAAWTALASPGTASAQRMDLALSRLSIGRADGAVGCDSAIVGAETSFCADNGQWRSLITEFTGALIPPTLSPATTRGPSSFYVGLDTSITGISSSSTFWHRGTEGQTVMGDENRQVDGALAFTRVTIRKAFPFGFELGTNIGYLVNTSYWALGLDIRWSILEGWLSHDWVVPDIAFRGSVQTLVGDQEFNATVAMADVTISNGIIIGDAFELTPITGGGVAWTWADSELIDLTPNTNAFASCIPDPNPPTTGPTTCGAGGSPNDFNNNTVFASIRTMRPRAFVGLQARYEAFTLTGMFSGDLIPPTDIGSNGLVGNANPGDVAPRLSIDRQWRIDIGVGLTY